MKTLLLSILCCLTITLFAKDPVDSIQLFKNQLIDSIENTLHYKTGTITLKGGIASINLPKGFKFLDAEEAQYIIEDLWGNLKGSAPLGMIIPADQSASIADYAFIIEYDAIGYVKDDDATSINYEDLLKDMKEESVMANEERRKEGLLTMDIIGWAASPYYDKNKNVLHWAKEYRVEGREINTLNYDIRVLGRKGVLILQAVSDISQLDSVKKNIDPLLTAVTFTNGNKYSDFNSSTDEVAAWTIGGLVAGKVLAKAGFFAVIMKFLKFIILGFIAAGGAIWKFITGRRKQNEELAYSPVSINKETES